MIDRLLEGVLKCAGILLTLACAVAAFHAHAAVKGGPLSILIFWFFVVYIPSGLGLLMILEAEDLWRRRQPGFERQQYTDPSGRTLSFRIGSTLVLVAVIGVMHSLWLKGGPTTHAIVAGAGILLLVLAGGLGWRITQHKIPQPPGLHLQSWGDVVVAVYGGTLLLLVQVLFLGATSGKSLFGRSRGSGPTGGGSSGGAGSSARW